MILTVEDLQVASYEIEYTLENPMPFKDFVECVVSNEKSHVSKQDLALSNTKIENTLHK